MRPDPAPSLGGTLIFLGLIIAALLTAAALHEDRPRAESGSRADSRLSTARTLERAAIVSRRVERLRGLGFLQAPRIEARAPEEVRRIVPADFERSYPAADRRADETVLELLGLVAPGADLRALVGELLEHEVLGLYEPRRKRLTMVTGEAAADPRGVEMTLAHELTHALEDQRFGLREPRAGIADESTAYAALIEGTATRIGFDYADRHFKAGQGLEALLTQGLATRADLPPYIVESLTFPYLKGAELVSHLRRAGGWRLVNYALRRRPPASTEQVIHPAKYLAAEPPTEVGLDVGPLLGAGWRRLDAGTVGELDTRLLLSGGSEGVFGDRRAASAAAGWGGNRYELWRRAGPGPRDCPSPCIARHALVVAWSWDTLGDAREFDRAMARLLDAQSGARRNGRSWRLRRGGAALRAGGRLVTFALAPSPSLAGRLAAGSAGRR